MVRPSATVIKVILHYVVFNININVDVNGNFLIFVPVAVY